MGRIKSTLVKRSTKDIMASDKGSFSADFEENKRKVEQKVPGISKKLRNSIAGYISRLMKKKK